MRRQQDRIQQMINFIRTEAEEKAEEIRVQAEEEFAILKQSRVEDAKKQIRAQFERKEKLVDVEKRIQLSNLIKQNRLQVLQRKDAILKTLHDRALGRLVQSCDADFLNKCVVQACLSLNEERVTVLCRPEDQTKIDLDAVRSMYDASRKPQTRQLRHITVEPSLTDQHGVICQSLGDRIVVDNTIEFRLKCALDSLKPVINEEFFGVGQ